MQKTVCKKPFWKNWFVRAFFSPNVLNVNALKKACNQLIKSSLQFYILTIFVNWMSFSDLMINLQTNQTENGLEKKSVQEDTASFSH